MTAKLTPEERIDRFRLLAERRELDRLGQRTPSQIRRQAEVERLLEVESARGPISSRKGKRTAAA